MTRKILIIIAAVVLATASCGGDDADDTGSSGETGTGGQVAAGTGDAANGEKVFDNCVACHGPGGEGIEGLGKPLPNSVFVGSLNDAELVEFIKMGRPPDDPANTTGVAMPPKGGNPSLTDQDLFDVVAYIRTLS